MSSKIYGVVPKLLIIDDSATSRQLIKITIQEHDNCECYEAQNGLEGYEKACELQPHIILIDAIMPEMDGFEAIRLLRENPATQEIPILMISALDSHDEKVRVLESGTSDFISKPFDPQELIIRVNAMLQLYLRFLEKKRLLEQIKSDLETKVTELLNERADRMKLATMGEMAAAITHELNTPVTFMKSNLELLRFDVEDIKENGELKSSMSHTVDVLEDGIKRLRIIIDTTRELTKKSKGIRQKENLYETLIFSMRMIYNRSKYLTPVYINGTLFDLQLSESRERFETELFREKIEQVWIIILNNICDEFEESDKAMELRRTDITITQEGPKVRVLFTDNAGDGIDPQILPKIFDPFASTKVDKGMGIGLNVAKEIVDLHQGRIKAYNEKSKAHFEIIL